MTAKDCIVGRRSIRKFKSDAVSHELLSEIVETASYAPSWKHTQITHFKTLFHRAHLTFSAMTD